MQLLRELLRKYWGYDTLRPLQGEAIAAVAAGRDSLVVLPTGGGKSLCYQLPAVAAPGLAVVVSPLISLMNDQVAALVDCGVPAASMHSGLESDEWRRVNDLIRSGRLKLLYLSPERLLTEAMLTLLNGVDLSFIAIDEAHCISDWGHDFRPEYRGLRELKQHFPQVGLHAYTATATETVRADIIRQLGLVEPEVLVGSFDRPNLCYRVARRGDRQRQIREVLDRHDDESGIIYCLRRRDVDELCASLQVEGIAALPYHAGLPDAARRANQDAFRNDSARIIVATVAFGMGIDKSNVRFVIHAGAPKSLEAYQQESGRAGRDGLEAECCLFYSPADFLLWRRFQAELPPEAIAASEANLAGMERFCAGVGCRHQAILEHFGQSSHEESSADGQSVDGQSSADAPTCGACDVCLGELKFVDDALQISQKIGSCVARLKESFGGEYTSLVLVGSREQKIIDRRHDQLSTWGILKQHDKRHVRDWVEQLVDQKFLEKTGEFSVLRVTDAGWRMLRGELTPRLLEPAEKPRRSRGGDRAGSGAGAGRSGSSRGGDRNQQDAWLGVDMELFEKLRAWRRATAAARSAPPYVVFADGPLRDLARRRPSTSDALLGISGIGERKRTQYGEAVLKIIAEHCAENGVSYDADLSSEGLPPEEARRARSLGSRPLRTNRGPSGGGAQDAAAADDGEPIRFVPESWEYGESDPDFFG